MGAVEFRAVLRRVGVDRDDVESRRRREDDDDRRNDQSALIVLIATSV